MFETFLKEANRKLQQAKGKVNGKLQRTFKRLKPVYHEYSVSIGISLCLGIVLKVIDLKHELFDNLVSSTNQFLNISSVLQIDHSSIISMSATILFTVLAIIFALLIFFTQTSYEYTIIDIFEEDNIRFLIGLYFTTIVLSLMMLVTTFQYPIFLLTLTLACIFSLYPFLRNISNKLVFEVGVIKLGVEIPLQIASNNEPFTRVKIMSLEKVSRRCIKDNRYDAFIAIMNIYEEITKMAKEHQMTEVIKLIGINYSNLLELVIEDKLTKSNRNTMIMKMEGNIQTYVSNYTDMVTTEFLNTILVGRPLNTVIKRIKDGFEEDYFNERIVILCYKSYSEFKKRGTDNYQMEQLIIESLGELAKESHNHNLSRSCTISIGALFTIGAKTCLNEIPVYPRPLVINKLEDIEKYINHDNFEKVYDDFNRISHISLAFGERALEPYFDKFKELYDESK